MGVSWSKEQRDLARKNKLALVMIAVDRRPGSLGGAVEFSQPIEAALAKRVVAFMADILKVSMQRDQRRGERPRQAPA